MYTAVYSLLLPLVAVLFCGGLLQLVVADVVSASLQRPSRPSQPLQLAIPFQVLLSVSSLFPPLEISL